MSETAYEKGKNSYEIMKRACDKLVASGNWQRVGASDIKLFLDMYVQALLLHMAQSNGELSAELAHFIATIPSRDVLNIAKADSETALRIGYKNRSFAEGTPLLLRCCIAMDDKDGTTSSQEFVSGVTQLLYAAAEADGDMNGREMQFITSYAGGLRTFLMSRAAGRHAIDKQHDYIPGEFRSKGKTHNREKDEPIKTPQSQEPEETLEEVMSQLDGLIGLKEVKKEVHTLANLIRVREMRREHELKVMDMSFHMVFTGNPGTGKTTVARLIAKIYKKLGFLSKGQLVETDRSGLVAGYVGQTAGKVSEVVNSALGGILFIDEAYALARKGMDNDFGKEAIDTLVKLMEDHRDDLVVIVAGYTDEMHDFLTSNPGLISRFNKYIDFPDYTIDELMDILAMNAQKQGYALTEQATTGIRLYLERMTIAERLDFGNARGMRNVLEKLVSAQANRIAEKEKDITKQLLMTLTQDDVIAALPVSDEDIQEALEKTAVASEDGSNER